MNTKRRDYEDEDEDDDLNMSNLLKEMNVSTDFTFLCQNEMKRSDSEEEKDEEEEGRLCCGQ